LLFENPTLVKLFQGALASQARGEAAAALLAYRRIQRQFPDFADAWANASVLLCAVDRPEEALAAAERALELDGGNRAAVYGQAMARKNMGQGGEAEAGLLGLLDACPDNHQAMITLAAFYGDEGRYAESLAMYDRACALAPSNGPLLASRGVVKMWATDMPGAEADFRAAIALGAANDAVRMNLALTLLIQGRYLEAWPWFGPYMALGSLFETYGTGRRRWDGGPLHGGALMVRTSFHGFGDVIQFARLMPQVKLAAGGRVLLSVYEPVLRLLNGLDGLPGVDALVVQEKDDPPFDAVTNLLELPVLLKLDSAALPPPIEISLPDAAPAPELLRPGFKVGLAWAGNPTHSCDAQRSMSPRCLDALAGIEGAEHIAWYGLQKPPALEPPRLPGFTDMSRYMGDFQDTAQVVRRLDMVATVDTSMLHLAGSLGVPTVALLAHVPEWRWQLGETTPWYPAVRLIRQTGWDDWRGAVERLGAEIGKAAGAKHSQLSLL
jgi:tetratricopeptide (TPR) repeat protein